MQKCQNPGTSGSQSSQEQTGILQTKHDGSDNTGNGKHCGR